MKIVALGDTHGRDTWEKIVGKNNDADKIIFIGDYFDTHYDITTDQQIENFTKILEFKKNNMEQVVLLLGNHDFHYLKGAGEKYSGHDTFRALDINIVLQPAVDSGLVQMCFKHDKYVFTHAGVTKTWCLRNGIKTNDLEKEINDKFTTELDSFCFAYGPNMSQTGNDVTQSPIWVRIPSLFADAIDDITYVIGHTTQENIVITDKIIAIDTIGTSGEYLVIEKNTPIAKKL